MNRAYYSSNIQAFLLESDSSVLGKLTANHSNRTLEELQVNAWRKQITILKIQLKEFEGQIYFEFTIPRMGKRVDNIVIINNVAFIIEFKVLYLQNLSLNNFPLLFFRCPLLTLCVLYRTHLKYFEIMNSMIEL